MEWSVTLGTVRGTAIRMHMTFLLLLVWIWLMHYRIGGAPAAWEGTVFVVCVFACVVLHEFGHIAVARRFGIRTPDIILLPIGGVARLERMPTKPFEELLIAIAGPLVNVVIAALLVAFIGGAVGWDELTTPEDPSVNFLVRLAGVNVFLVLFNMIPAFPMDGGRVLRAVLAMRWPWGRATRVAARIGQGVAFAMGIVGLFYNPLLILIAVFVYLAAQAEAQGSDLEAISGQVAVGDVMVTKFAVLEPSARLDDAVELLLATSQNEFPIVGADGTFEGLLTRDGIIAAMKEGRAHASVLSVMRAEIPTIARDTAINESLRIMRAANSSAAAVVDQDKRLVGLMNLETIGELLMLRAAAEDFRFDSLRRHRTRP
ncbi:Zn-dependent protease/predicted transcriptional regulator [Mycoplana sp. BE70]|uniref:site-2 protease family protein n=1 Tax=Mycoplana sp. BE70 TaxID=2817775 RepID=UPI002863B235|nr:site-2 protease family protein [Mycoplana sp. BE70]MDR6757086.1 Zn-dependent protease/predicted transcriptional regulator [Mycoplana sp. BE70]